MCPCLELIVTICCKCDDGAVECLESELVHHDASDVYRDVSPLDRRVDLPCFADDRDGSESGHIDAVPLSVAVIPEMRRRGLYNTMVVVLWANHQPIRTIDRRMCRLQFLPRKNGCDACMSDESALREVLVVRIS